MNIDRDFIVEIETGRVRQFDGTVNTLPILGEVYLGELIDKKCHKKNCMGRGYIGVMVGANKNMHIGDPVFCSCVSRNWDTLKKAWMDDKKERAVNREELSEEISSTAKKLTKMSTTWLGKFFYYSSYLIRHRWFVMIECFKMGLIWQGIMHDISKYSFAEFFAYMNYFTKRDESGYYKATRTADTKFDLAWNHHAHNNKHHWQYWITPEISTPHRLSGDQVLDMPIKYVKEMIADWRGAPRAEGKKGATGQKFYLNNVNNMVISAVTKKRIETILFGSSLTIKF